MDYPSKLIEDAVNQVAKLPGIGKKTALRLVLHLIKNKEENTHTLTEALSKLRIRRTHHHAWIKRLGRFSGSASGLVPNATSLARS